MHLLHLFLTLNPVSYYTSIVGLFYTEIPVCPLHFALFAMKLLTFTKLQLTIDSVAIAPVNLCFHTYNTYSTI